MTPGQMQKEVERALGRRASGLAETILMSLLFTVVTMTGGAGEDALAGACDMWENDMRELRQVADHLEQRQARQT